MRKYARTLLKKNEAVISSNNREEFHKAYRQMYRLGFRRAASYYVHLWIFYKEFWVQMKHDGKKRTALVYDGWICLADQKPYDLQNIWRWKPIFDEPRLDVYQTGRWDIGQYGDGTDSWWQPAYIPKPPKNL